MIRIKTIAPVEEYKISGIDVTVSREDLRPSRPLPPHGKMPALREMCRSVAQQGYKAICAFGSKYSNWTAGLPYLARHYQLGSIVIYPANRMADVPAWLQQSMPDELVTIKPNMVGINMAQAKKIAEEKGAYFIPFGLETQSTLDILEETISLPDRTGTLIITAGSGMTLAGVLMAIRKNGAQVDNIVAVSSGRPIDSIKQTVSRNVGALPSNIIWVREFDYANVPTVLCPWDAHDHFELKAYDWLIRNIKLINRPIWFINMGGNP